MPHMLAADYMGYVHTLHELTANGNQQLSDQHIYSLSQLYNHLKTRNVNASVKIILKTKHNSHVTFTNKFKFLKWQHYTVQNQCIL